MGRIADLIKDKVEQFKEDRERRRKIEEKANRLSRDAYNSAYVKSRVARGSHEGREAGWKKRGGGGFLSTLARYGESFSKAGEETFGLGSLNKLGEEFSHRPKKRQTSHLDEVDLGELGLGLTKKKKQKDPSGITIKIYTNKKRRKR